MSYRVELSHRAARELDRLGRDVQERMMKRLVCLARSPIRGACESPASEGWRILFTVDDETRLLRVVTIERRGQVYQRI